MSSTEADTFTSTEGLISFDPNKAGKQMSGEPVNDALARLAEKYGQDVSTEETTDTSQTGEKPVISDAQKKADEEGKKVVDAYSKVIQEHAEQLYETLSYRAKTEDGFINKLLESKDKTEQKMAKKIIERNAEHFGAATAEEYRLNIAKKNAKTPEEAKLLETEHKIAAIEQKQSEQQWQTWKKENSVSGEAAAIADEIRAQYPEMPYGLVMDAVKGRLGGNTVSTKTASSVVGGSVAAPQEQEIDISSPLAKGILKNVNVKATQKFAKEYLRTS